MGLDSIELLVEVEKTFDIEIANSEAAKIVTVSDFYNVVWEHIKDKKSDKCASAMIFSQLRKFLVDRYNIPFRDFFPDRDLNELISFEIRKTDWKKLQHDFDFELPDLELPDTIKQILNYTGIILVAGSLIFAIICVFFFDKTGFVFFLPVLGILLVMIIYYQLRPYRTEIAEKSIREFIEAVLALNYKKIRIMLGANRAEMEKIINYLIHEKTGVDYSEIKPEAQIVNDLGIN
jgi:hypothetical protein